MLCDEVLSLLTRLHSGRTAWKGDFGLQEPAAPQQSQDSPSVSSSFLIQRVIRVSPTPVEAEVTVSPATGPTAAPVKWATPAKTVPKVKGGTCLGPSMRADIVT